MDTERYSSRITEILDRGPHLSREHLGELVSMAFEANSLTKSATSQSEKDRWGSIATDAKNGAIATFRYFRKQSMATGENIAGAPSEHLALYTFGEFRAGEYPSLGELEAAAIKDFEERMRIVEQIATMPIKSRDD